MGGGCGAAGAFEAAAAALGCSVVGEAVAACAFAVICPALPFLALFASRSTRFLAPAVASSRCLPPGPKGQSEEWWSQPVETSESDLATVRHRYAHAERQSSARSPIHKHTNFKYKWKI